LSVFRFKYFDVRQEKNPLKVGTDSMLLGALINASDIRHALDLGAGTGVLSLMLAQKNQEIAIDAIELDESGAEECYFNIQSI
jgi:tRNA1Val (adenine37-N6)-methyltransferase